MTCLFVICILNFVIVCLNFLFLLKFMFVFLLYRDPQDTYSDTDSLSSSLGRKQFSVQSTCATGTDTPPRKISREEFLLLAQEAQAAAMETLPSSSPSSPLDSSSVHKGSPDLTRSVLPESQSLTFHPGTKAVAYNGILEKSYSLGQLPAGGTPSEGLYPSISSLDTEGKAIKEPKQLHTSQDSCDNAEKKRSKIKSLFKKSKKL